MRRPILALATLACLAPALPARAAGDFQFILPPGWRDIGPGSARAADGIPQEVLREANSGKYVAFYVEPRDAQTVGASFNAVSTAQTTRITPKVLEDARNGFAAAAEKQGLTFDVRLAGIVDIQSVPSARIVSDIASAQVQSRVLQYIVPGRRSTVVLSYACRPEDFDRYLPVFEAAASATTGAYRHGAFDWEQMYLSGALAVVAWLVFRLVYSLRNRGARPAAPGPAAGEGGRECPACHRRVPMRIATCRCGQAMEAR